MKAHKFALAAAFILAGTAAFSEISTETRNVIDTFLASQQYERAEVRVGLNQIKVEMISNGQKVEVILDKADGTELKREAEAADVFDDNTAGVFIRERNRDFLRADDDSNDDEEDGDDSDDDSSDDDSSDDDSSGGSDGRSDDSNDDNGGDSDSSDDSNDDDSNDDDSNDDDSNDDNGSDDNSGGNDSSDDNGDDD
jgi:hypothetical protein